MRVVAVHADVIVFVSRVWQTTCTAVRSSDRTEGFVIDSPVYPDELEALPGVLEQANFPVSGLLATHGDWDHLLGRLAFPGASLGCAESTAERLRDELGTAQRKLRQFDEEHYVERPGPLALAGIQTLPVPGRLSLGATDEQELELHRADGHTADGAAYWIAGTGVLVCGDYLSPVEIPMISEGGSIDAYRTTLERLAPVIRAATTVVPGHGTPMTSEQCLGVWEEDVAYVDALQSDPGQAPLPASRRNAAQRRVHAQNLAGREK